LFLTLTSGSPAQSYTPTIFDTFTKEVQLDKSIDGDEEDSSFSTKTSYSLGLWDTSGSSEYDEVRPICYPHTDCFVICYAVNDRASFENVESKWKPEILRFGDGPIVPIILAGLKSDLNKKDTHHHHHRQDEYYYVSLEEGRALQNKIGAKAFFECSTKDGGRRPVDALLQACIEFALAKKAEEDKPPNPIWGFEDLRILVVGDSTVGKSAILTGGTRKKVMTQSHIPTTEIVPYYQDIVLDGIEYFLGLYDMPSAPEFLHDRIKEYRRANGVIIVYAVNDPFSFQNVELQWVPEVLENTPSGTPFIIVGNKIDLKKFSQVLIPSVDGEELMLSTKGSAFIECSGKTLENIPQIFITAAKCFSKRKEVDKQ